MPTTSPHTDSPLSPRGLPTPEHASDASLVYHIILLLFCLFGLFILFRLPRALALFGGVSRDWAAGHILFFDKSIAAAAASPSRRARRGRRGTISDNAPGSSEKESSANVPRARPYPALHFPPHVPSCPAALRFLLAPLRARVPFLASAGGGGAGMGMGQGLILAVYFYAWVYAALFRSNVFTDPARTGWIAAAQVPIVFALAGKNGVGWLGGWGYEKLNFLHRFVGRLIVFAANIHSLHYFYFWSINGTFRSFIQNPSNTWGMVALVAVNFIFLFSVQSVRARAYNLFLLTHILGFLLILPAMYMHQPTLLPYVLFAAGFLALDHTLRLLKSRYTTAYLTPLPELEMTRIEIPTLNAGWRAGQHVRLRVLAPRAMGAGLGEGAKMCLEVHPFTIANVARKEGGEGMVLMCKAAGGWTRALYDVARSSSSASSASSSSSSSHPTSAGTAEKAVGTPGLGRPVRVVVEGPYGGPGHVNFASFAAAVFVVGGSGVTYALAAVEDLVRRDAKGESRVKVVEVVWIVADPACLAPLLPTFTRLISQSIYTPLRISVFYTRAPIGKQPAFFGAVEASPFASSSSGGGNASSAPAYTTHAHGGLETVAEGSHSIDRSSSEDHEHEHDEQEQGDNGYRHSEHSQHQSEHEFDSYARPRPRPRPVRSTRPGTAYEAPRAAPAPPQDNGEGSSGQGRDGMSAKAVMGGQMASPVFVAQPQAQSSRERERERENNGPQRQDSSASARTLVGRENSTKSTHYKSRRGGGASTPQPHSSQSQSHGQQQHGQGGHGQGHAHAHSQAYTQPHLPRGLTLAPGRPKLSQFLEHALQRAVALSSSSSHSNSHGRGWSDQGEDKDTGKIPGMVVAVCGPGGLADDVVAAVGVLDPKRREQVGGVEVCEEVFGF